MRLWLSFAILVMAVRPVAAQSLLPQRFAGWETVPGSAAALELASLQPENAALLRACHEETAERRSYQKNDATINITLYRMADPTYGYSAFSMLRPQPAIGFRPSPHSAIGTDNAMLLVGNLIVGITGQNLPSYAHDFSSLVAALGPHASGEPYPTLWQYLPTSHFVPHSDRYVLDPATLSRALAEVSGTAWPAGDWLGFSDEVEAEVARYNVAGHPMTLLLASYPTGPLAAEHVKDMKQWFSINPAAGAAPNGRPVLYMRRLSSLVGFVSGARNAAQAQRLLAEIHYQTVVTWNEPGFKLKNLTMPEYVVGIIFGTITIILITLVSGIALGIIRIGIKRTFPGVIFDRRRSIEVIQLGLTTKPIDLSDFYRPSKSNSPRG